MIYLCFSFVFSINFALVDQNKGTSNIYIEGNSYLFNYPCFSPYDCTPYSGILEIGQYLFEVWGAEGGRTQYSGGKGGYSSGIMSIVESTQIYIHLGGTPDVNTGMRLIYGGYNGGGRALQDSNCNGGGGGTDIRIGSNSLYARVIVGGGGGGGNGYIEFYPGAGGGLEGQFSTYGPTSNGGKQGSGGTGGYGTDGTFGYGGNHSGQSAGGGGGWYGGTGSSNQGQNTGGGGGSGYVFTSTSYAQSGFLLSNQYYLSNASTISGQNTIPSPVSGTEVGHSGNGCARITLLLDLPNPSNSNSGLSQCTVVYYCNFGLSNISIILLLQILLLQSISDHLIDFNPRLL